MITEAQIKRFTKGDCVEFAVALSLLKGGQIAVISLPRKRSRYHAVVVLDDGRYADVSGVMTEGELLDKWPGYALEEGLTSPKEVLRAHNNETFKDVVRAAYGPACVIAELLETDVSPAQTP